MAPEFQDNEQYDAEKTDIWAFGILLDELLHGKSFFSAKTTTAIITKVMKVDYIVRDKGLF